MGQLNASRVIAHRLHGDLPGRLHLVCLHGLRTCSAAVADAAAVEPAVVHAAERPALWVAGTLACPIGAGGWAAHLCRCGTLHLLVRCLSMHACMHCMYVDVSYASAVWVPLCPTVAAVTCM